MTTEQAYEKFINKAEKNAVNDNIATDRARFVLMYNEAQNKYIENSLDKRNEDDIKFINRLLVDDKKISLEKEHLDHCDFKLPEDYFDFSNVYGKADKGKCKNKTMFLFEIKDENRHEILQDVNNKPSFNYREAPYTLSNNRVKIYTDSEFKITKIYLSYYRYPKQIELKDYNDPEQGFKVGADPEFDDRIVDRIISLTVAELQMNTENPNSKVSRERAISEM